MKIPSGVPYAALSLGLKHTIANKVDRMSYYVKKNTLQSTSGVHPLFYSFPRRYKIIWSPKRFAEMENKKEIV